MVKEKKPDKKRLKSCQEELSLVKKEIAKVIVGQKEVIDGILRGLIADGHVLIEGMPGIAKTLMVRAIAVVVGCKFSRIQFTVDLLPTDIIGITTYDKNKGFTVLKGPIFSNFVMADEINRAPPKVQSALLECMQEKQATIGRETYSMPTPFFVMATQNPIETAGVYELPEAQIDRFLFKLKMNYPGLEEEQYILNQNITLRRFEDYKLKGVLNPNKILELQKFAKSIYLDKDIENYVVKIVDATRNPEKYKIKLGKYIQYGGSPRASISLFIGGKCDAVLRGEPYVTPQNIKNVAYDVLRHRIILNYEGQAEGIKTENIIKEILSEIPTP